MDYPVFTERTAGSREDFEKMLKKTAEKGYAVDNEEEIIGVSCLSCPVFNGRGYPIAALWITGPSSRLSEQTYEDLGVIVSRRASHISSLMGYESADQR